MAPSHNAPNNHLEVRYEYVLWVEQSYPKGGKEGKLTKLIEKCLLAMYSSADLREKYVNDQWFLDMWIKYTNLSPNPLEIYQTVESKGCVYLWMIFTSAGLGKWKRLAIS